MGLKGQLEDLPFLDMLQIAAFSQKSGYLRVEGPLGSGAVVFKMGLVQCAYSWSTLEHHRFVAQTGLGSVDEQVLKKQVELSLRELAGLREGTFEFELAEEVGEELDGVDISPFLQRGGGLLGRKRDVLKPHDGDRERGGGAAHLRADPSHAARCPSCVYTRQYSDGTSFAYGNTDGTSFA